MLNFSKDILINLIQQMDLNDVLTCSLISKRFHTLSNNNQIWKRLYRNKFDARGIKESNLDLQVLSLLNETKEELIWKNMYPHFYFYFFSSFFGAKIKI